MLFDYDTLKVIWWGFIGALLVGFALTDGFDLGIGILLPFVGRSDAERRVMINTISAHWEGNQTWFITAGGALFAAWPLLYGAAFSGFYGALMLLLFALFFRPVGFDYRSKIASTRWRSTWDWCLFIGGVVPALVFGIAFGNLMLGVPFYYDDTMRMTYTGTFFALLNPFGMLCGTLSVSMLALHGASYLQLRTDAAVAERARMVAMCTGLLVAALFVAGGLVVAYLVEGFHIIAMPAADTAFMPLAKTVQRLHGGWLSNYAKWPALWVVPLAALLGTLLCSVASMARRPILAFIGSTVAVAGIIVTAGSAMFPFLMPSSSDPNSSLTAWDAVASHKSLGLMFWVVVVMMPIVILYSSWAYRIMRGKVTLAYIRENDHTAY